MLETETPRRHHVINAIGATLLITVSVSAYNILKVPLCIDSIETPVKIGCVGLNIFAITNIPLFQFATYSALRVTFPRH